MDVQMERRLVGLEHVRVRLTEVSLEFEGELTYEEWSETGRGLQRIGRSWQWWVGDWLNRGEQVFGEEYAQEIDLAEWSDATIRGAQWVADRVPPSRRRSALSWSHHDAIAALEPAVQDRLLDSAVANGWSVARLREAVKAYKKELATPSKPEGDDLMPPEFGSPEDPDVDPVRDLQLALEEAEQEIERLHEQLDSLTKADKDEEIRTLHKRLQAIELRLRGEMRSGNEAKKQAKFYAGQMREIRKLLGVERTSDLEAAVRRLVQQQDKVTLRAASDAGQTRDTRSG